MSRERRAKSVYRRPLSLLASRFSLLALFLSPALYAQEAPQTQDEFSDFEEFKIEGDTVAPKVFDPLQGYNRFMFAVNDKFYFWFLKPVAKGYNKVMPEFARCSFNRAFQNLAFPLRFVSSLFQLKFKKAGTEVGRFVINSTVGIGGLWDPAEKYLKWHPANEDLGQMLGRWGVGDGFPIVLPILGHTNLRDGIGRIGAIWLNPIIYISEMPVPVYVGSGERFNYASLHLGEYESIKKDALDPYTLMRDAYKQLRDQAIKE